MDNNWNNWNNFKGPDAEEASEPAALEHVPADDLSATSVSESDLAAPLEEAFAEEAIAEESDRPKWAIGEI